MTFLTTLDTNIIRAPREDQWAPGYYSILFEDPDGIRLELNHVPGKGLLAVTASWSPDRARRTRLRCRAYHRLSGPRDKQEDPDGIFPVSIRGPLFHTGGHFPRRR